MNPRLPFQFECPVSVFEKADAPEGRERRIGGIISTETPDREGEIVLAKGLDFGEFLAHGWFNDNHSKATTGILGYPESVSIFRKGQRLPDGQVAKTNGVWAEGYLLDTPPADAIWRLGKALAKTQRRLGFSVEGTVQKRKGNLRKTVAKAIVRNVAVTNCPVNTDSRLEILAKSLAAVEAADDDFLDKALAMGPATPGAPPTGGAVLVPESLESDPREMKRRKRQGAAMDGDEEKKLTKAEAVAWVRERIPHMTEDQAIRFVNTTQALKRHGRL